MKLDYAEWTENDISYINTEDVITMNSKPFPFCRKLYLRSDLENVFIPEAFKIPLFNNVMEKELLKALALLQKDLSDERLYSDIEKIISELISINTGLIKTLNFSFDSISEDLSRLYRPLCYKDKKLKFPYFDRNPKIIVVHFGYATIGSLSYNKTRKYTAKDVWELFGAIGRKMSDLGFWAKTDESYYNYLFIKKFFMDLYRGCC